jgi:hypothetical protein
MPTPTLENLRAQLAATQNQANRLMAQIWMNPSSPYYRNPRANPAFHTHTDLETRVIPNLRRRIARREEANRARSAAKHARERRLARAVTAKWRARTMRPPNKNVHGNEGGKSYKRIARGAASPTLRRLMNQLDDLRELNKNKNRGAMVNLYGNMSNKWGRASNWRAAANIMNKAQAIMFKAGLII